MSDNLVSQPPLTTAITDGNGILTRAWAIWLRDVYKRIAYKGGNSIDDNTSDIDFNFDTIADVIDQVIINISDIEQNADDLKTHESLEEAHGSNGNIVGFDDVSDELTLGLVKRMASIANAVDSTVNIVTTDIDTAPAAYDQAYTQLVAELTNENKAAINQLASDLNDAIAVLNNLLEESKNSGQMTT